MSIARYQTLLLALGLLAGPLRAQPTVAPAACPTPAELERRVQALRTAAAHPHWAGLADALQARAAAALRQPGAATPEAREALRQAIACAEQLARDLAALPEGSPWRQAPYVGYAVEPMSALRRTPDTLPADGDTAPLLSLVAAQDEYEPASFVLAPLRDVARFEIHPAPLQGPGGAIPAENLDLRIVKCWWQCGTAWTSYFADSSKRELVPELLLKDDSLVTVDLEAREQYLRVDYPGGPEQVWISYTYPPRPSLERDIWFDYLKEPCADAATLQPLPLTAGRAQQFWLTVKVPPEAKPGLYTGRLDLVADGQAAGSYTVRLRVLPFALPEPRTYYDPGRTFFATMYRLGSLQQQMRGFDNLAEAEARLMKIFRNLRAHGINHYYGSYDGTPEARRTFELVREAGFRPPLFATFSAAVSVKNKPGTPAYTNAFAEIRRLRDEVARIVGHDEIYTWGAGEPGRATILAQLQGWKDLQAMGLKVAGEGNPRHLPVCGFAEELTNFGGQDFFDRRFTAPAHVLGHRMMAYASPHPGNENPEVSRRHHGLLLYKSDFDGTCNHAWFVERDSIQDFWLPYGYRDLLINQIRGGVLDSLAWEAFREGMDDIRYATLLRQTAAQAIASGNIEAVLAAKQALLDLELADARTVDLTTLRLEIINHLLALQAML